MPKKPSYEEIKISGKDVVAKVKEIIEAGNARRIIVKKENGDEIVEIPLVYGVIGTLLLPALATLGAAAALLTKCTIIVERDADDV